MVVEYGRSACCKRRLFFGCVSGLGAGPRNRVSRIGDLRRTTSWTTRELYERKDDTIREGPNTECHESHGDGAALHRNLSTSNGELQLFQRMRMLLRGTKKRRGNSNSPKRPSAEDTECCLAYYLLNQLLYSVEYIHVTKSPAFFVSNAIVVCSYSPELHTAQGS